MSKRKTAPTLSRVFVLRLALDGLAAAALVFAFAYHWQGNLAHEAAGLGIFLLLCMHNLFHLKWFSTLGAKLRDRRSVFNGVLTLVLLTGMLALLGSSLLISETLFPSLRLADDFDARLVHAGVAYWLLLIVSMHIGLRWPMIMAITRSRLGLAQPHPIRIAILRLGALAIALHGLWGAAAIDLPSRLLFRMSLDWWNFEESTFPFFLNVFSVAGLFASLSHYTARGLQRFSHPS
ncbi:DUF4405 domain-containing protein [Comamonadaceae bacterium PP-2]